MQDAEQLALRLISFDLANCISGGHNRRAIFKLDCDAVHSGFGDHGTFLSFTLWQFLPPEPDVIIES